ncbi:hypothetical protein PsorP6_016950 [Peronosclerospora sorghi]|uniref:Uncharacterized protein n=1 Tax=Peronosclerospora sorghi TaxID=230839 RepID=A0ACC0WBE9_9STRA|nr:hypothetical protein PsorP6_016950 [Peronosclerospora sorghi]
MGYHRCGQEEMVVCHSYILVRLDIFIFQSTRLAASEIGVAKQVSKWWICLSTWFGRMYLAPRRAKEMSARIKSGAWHATRDFIRCQKNATLSSVFHTRIVSKRRRKNTIFTMSAIWIPLYRVGAKVNH